MDITWSAIGSWFSFSATTVTCNILSFKPSHLISIIKRCLIWFTMRNSLLQNVKGNYLPGIPVMNQTQPNQTSHLFLLIQTFVLSSNQYVAAQSVLRLGYMLEDLGFKSWQKQQNYLFSRTRPDQIQHPTSLQLNENQSFFSGSKVAGVDNLTTHIHLEPSLKFSAATPPQNLSPSMAHSRTTLFYLKLLPMYTLLKRSFLVLKEPFCTIHASYMHTTWPIYFICIEQITLTLWRVPIQNIII